MAISKLYGPDATKLRVSSGNLEIVEDIFDQSSPTIGIYEASDMKDYIEKSSKINCNCCSIGRSCSSNTEKDLKSPVVYHGNYSAPILFVGEAPGKEEWELKTPFVGKSGKLLRSTITGSGIDIKHVGFANCVMCRPTDNIAGVLKDRKPSTEEVNSCMSFLLKLIFSLKPYLIVAVGRTAAVNLFGFKSASKSAPLEEIRGLPFTVRNVRYSRDGKKYFSPMGYVIYHPASTMGGRDESGSKKVSFIQDIRKLGMLCKDTSSLPKMSAEDIEKFTSKESILR